MNKLHLDFETRSTVDLKLVGAWAYAQHPSTEILCMGWMILGSDAKPNVNTGAQLQKPSRMMGSVLQISAHNAHFEYAIYNYILHLRYGWPELWDPARWNCTMARAAMCGLPLDLDGLGRVLQIKTPKDLEGRRVMQQLCRPLGIDALGDPLYDNDPLKLQKLYAYNATDVRAEMEIDALLPELPPHERKIWELDLAINRRGIQIDVDLARRGAAISEQLVIELNAQLRDMTGGAIDKATQVAALKDYLLKVHNVTVDSLDKAAVTDLLADPSVPEKAKQIINIRRQVSKSTSTAKYAKALEMICADGRVRGTMQYHAAHTGRFGGRLIQPHNMPQGLKAAEQEAAIELTKNPPLFSLVYGDKAMETLSDCSRGLIVAAPGKLLVSADYNAIEARGIFWLAGDEAALATYRRGESPYLDMGESIYRRKITKTGDPQEYDIAKRTVLGCGYGMGAPKFKDTVYNETAKKGTPVTISEELAERAVRAYREKYSAVVRMWYAIEAAAINAVRAPGKAYPSCSGKIIWSMSKDQRFLVARLPSGRYLWYWKPAVRTGITPWGVEKAELTYWGPHPKTSQWVQLKTYGGALTENVTQATARDLLAHGMQNVNDVYPCVLTVHDEIIGEVAGGVASEILTNFVRLMCTLPSWAAGWPVAAEGYVSRRFRK